jgi:hypothetical protein
LSVFALAKSEGTSRQEVIRRAVIERLEQAGHASRAQDTADRMLVAMSVMSVASVARGEAKVEDVAERLRVVRTGPDTAK